MFEPVVVVAQVEKREVVEALVVQVVAEDVVSEHVWDVIFAWEKGRKKKPNEPNHVMSIRLTY